MIHIHSHKFMRRSRVAVVFICLSGCIPASRPDARPVTVSDDQTRLARLQRERRGLLTLDALDQLTNAYADRMVTLIDAAANATSRDNPDARQRREAHRIKTYMSEAAYNIATRLDPLSQLADLLVLTALTRRVWVDDGFLRQEFGDRAAPLADVICRLDEEVWNTGKDALSPEQLEAIRRWVAEYRQKNPEATLTAFVTFDDVAMMRGGLKSARPKADSGLIDEILEARRAIDDSVTLAERAFWYFKRWPRLTMWQTEHLADKLAARPEVATALKDFSRISESIDRLSRTVDAFPDHIRREREAILADIDLRSADANSTIRLFNESVVELKDLVAQLKDTGALGKNVLQESEEASRSFKDLVGAIDGALARIERISFAPTTGRPFDINEYATALRDLTAAAREMNLLTASARGLVDSSAFSARLAELDGVLQRNLREATSGTSGFVDRALYRGIILIAVFFIGLALFKIYAVRLERRVLGRRAPAN